MYEPKNLKRWTLPPHYMGAHWDEWYVVLGQHRDSDIVTRCNFQEALKRLRPLGTECEIEVNGFPGSDVVTATVYVVSESHCLVGWVEWIAVHESNEAALKEADEIVESIECYPILNETALSEMEYKEVNEYWERESLRGRIEICKEAGVSIFAARRSYPYDSERNLYDWLRESIVYA